MQPNPRRDLSRCSCGLSQVGARPFASFRAGSERPEIDHGKTAEGLATIRAAMRDDVVACGGGFPDATIPRPKELDRGIDIVAANGARAPDSHGRCLLCGRMVRESRRRRPWPPRQRHTIRRNCAVPFRTAHMLIPGRHSRAPSTRGLSADADRSPVKRGRPSNPGSR